MAGFDPLRARLEDLGAEVATASDGELCILAERSQILALLRRLRDEPETAMRQLVDLTAIDRGGRELRFEIVYRLRSASSNRTMRVHAGLEAADPAIDSVVSLWPAADWLEREVFDLFGIRFRAHPDLRRILLAADFEGAPLRKDYPRQPNLPLPRAVAP